MASLKAFLPQLAKIAGTTADTLYSRQRALTQIGVLKATKGRGPGSGVALSGEAVAAMVIALMAADTLQDTDERVRRTCNATPKEGTCPWTGANTFQSALAAVLTSEELIKDIGGISISRDGIGQIHHYGSHRTQSLTTVFEINKRGRWSMIMITARINPEQIRQISKALRSELGDSV
jgi:hypothetical protein